MSVIAIVELSSFSKRAAKILDKEEVDALRAYLLQHPDKGDVIPGTGGVRKLRWAASGRGKRGGARVIYFYHVVGTKIYLMACYTKNEQDDIRPEVKKQMTAFVTQIKKGI
jgi:hypothetical protein